MAARGIGVLTLLTYIFYLLGSLALGTASVLGIITQLRGHA